jgi:NAD(P)-dependent dehydrogenase (short-subunit alcohol dehydrogenase family)
MSTSLSSAVAIITGAARGIGLEIASQCIAQGMRVALLDIETVLLNEAVATRGWSAAQALALPCDVSQEAQVNAAVAEVIAKFGRVDHLVNNAGVAVFKPLLEHTAAQWQRVMDVNLTGPFLCTQACAPYMLRNAGNQSEAGSTVRGKGKGKLSAFEASLELSLKADAQRPAQGRRSGRALFVQIQAQGYAGGYSRVTDFIRAWRAQSSKAQSKAFVPLVFELGEAFQFDWSEEGMELPRFGVAPFWRTPYRHETRSPICPNRRIPSRPIRLHFVSRWSSWSPQAVVPAS